MTDEGLCTACSATQTCVVHAHNTTPLKYPKRVRRFFGTFGTHPGPPCLWDSKASALENCEADERVYEFYVEMIREVRR